MNKTNARPRSNGSGPETAAPASDDYVSRAADAIVEMTRMPGWAILMNQFKVDQREALKELVAADRHDADEIGRLQDKVKKFSEMRNSAKILITQGDQTEEVRKQAAAEAEDFLDYPDTGEEEMPDEYG